MAFHQLFFVGDSGKMGQVIIPKVQEKNIKVQSCNRIKDCKNIALNTELIVDFSHPENVLPALELAKEKNIPFFSGTTGLDNHQHQALKMAAKQIPVFYTSNTSLGVAIMTKLIEIAAREVPEDTDINIHEVHHHHKRDFPSGTSISFGKSIAEKKSWDFSSVAQYDHLRQQDTKANSKSIHFSGQRAGEVPGCHDVSFYFGSEELTIRHRCYSRDVFANGAVKIIDWLYDKPKGYYTMQSMLC